MTKLLAKDGEGERLDRFELIAELASGGMATVFLARLSGVAGFQRLVAIKRLHPHLANEPEFVEMFLDEARLAARIHHPNVVPIQEVGESERGYYLVMDYVEGDTLARLLARASMAKTSIPYAVTIRILLDTLAGLHAAHELKDDHGEPLSIVHRDVSPQNILVGVDGVSRLVDFGVARAASRLATTRSGQLKGKLAYMAPEQARGGNIDRRADLFSCGIVLWEALALKRLFKGDGEAETLNRVLYEPINPPSAVKPDVPKALEAICMRALERDVDKRWPTARELGDELEKAARALSCVGSVRDVASCLEEVVGSDLSQQRDAVRAWLARSEPNTGSGPRPRKSSSELPRDSITRVEGGSKPGRSVPPPSSSSKGVDRLAITSPAPPEPGGERTSYAPIDKVSSVSSAVLQVPRSLPPASLPPPRSRTGLVVAALFGAAVLGGGAVWSATHFNQPRANANDRPPPQASTPPPPVATATASALPAAQPEPPATTNTPVASAEPAPTASAKAATRKGTSGTQARPATSAKPRGTAPPGTGVPDDLGNNPYR